MKISEFKSLISNLPVDIHSFSIKRENWRTQPQQSLIEKVFGDNQSLVNISRGELLAPPSDLREFAIKVLLWGYPRGGRGKNIRTLLTEENFETLLNHLEILKTSSNINVTQIQTTIKAIPRLGLSTLSKYLYFLGIKTEGYPSMILDLQIMDVVNRNQFEELEPLGKMRYDNGVAKFELYLKILNSISKELDVRTDQVEMFLIVFGKILSRD